MLTWIVEFALALMIATSTVVGGVVAAVAPSVQQIGVVPSANVVTTVQPVETAEPEATVEPSATKFPSLPSVAFATAAPEVVETPENGEYTTIQRGQSGDHVLRLQQRLSELGYYSDKLTGKMDSTTQLAFKKFEKNNGFTANGIASPEEQAVLFSEEAIAAQ